MNEMLQLVLLCATGGAVSILGAFLILGLKNKIKNWSSILTSFAAGVLLSVGILDLLPEAMEMIGDPGVVSWLLMAGVLFIFVLEKTGLWYHHHHEDHGHKPLIAGVLFGDVLHNFVDGMAIGASFLVDPTMGVMTTLAVAWHELPKEMADFWVYTNSGLSSARAIVLNLFSSVVAVFGGLLVYFLKDSDFVNTGYLLAITAGSFIFVSLSDLVPEMHEEMEKSTQKKKWQWMVTFGLGLLIGAFGRMMEV